MPRFSAKLLFQFRVDVGRRPNQRRLCEERIISFRSRSPRDALKHAIKRGRAAKHVYPNSDGKRVTFEFVGVLDLLCLELTGDDDEVWYEMGYRQRPMERQAKLLPTQAQLLARAT